MQYRKVIARRVFLNRLNNKIHVIIRQIYKNVADGKFEITEGNSIVVTGRINISNADQEITSTNILPENKEEEYMTARDIYKELKLRGYQYSGWFRGLHSASISGNKGHVVWKGNWVTFMDNMLQMHIIGYDTRNLYVPTSIQKLVIDPTLHANKLHYERNNVAVATQTNKRKYFSLVKYRFALIYKLFRKFL